MSQMSTENQKEQSVLNNEDKMADQKTQEETYSSAVKKNFVIESVLSSVKPVFILENDIFGSTKPNKEQFITHIELYKTIDANICPGSHLKALQRVRGLWRIYFDDDTDREYMISKGMWVRDKIIPVYTRNPRIMVNENPIHLKVRVKNVPCSAEDGQIERALEYYGCTVHKSYRERLRVDGELTNCQTGDRIVICDPVSEPLPRSMLIGKYVATVLHANQNSSEGHKIVCRKCLQTGHKVMQCPNDWICLHCKKPGHRQADCPEDEEESDANDADTEVTEVPPAHAHDALQPSNSGDVLSIIHAKDKAQSVNNHLQDKIQCDQEIVNGGENDEKKKPKHKKRRKIRNPVAILNNISRDRPLIPIPPQQKKMEKEMPARQQKINTKKLSLFKRLKLRVSCKRKCIHTNKPNTK
ncbi:Hypothetical predicted protein [Mytilus galloprovincialis]|uniref:CCHC-type domain-containing protein n=1 Tax=Mytilus galloprovincialis TaxID=29158 RepID=A0A8B6C4V6_MYTGA|nr:Hypothetical predicted protein [Mytilus galloprovincialis]